jgi:hypothetical protein
MTNTAQQSPLVPRINDAIGAHGMWKMRLRTAISTGKGDASSRTVACDDQCDFGKWLYGPSLTPAIKAGVPYQVIRRLHAEFHQSAGQVLRLVEQGNMSAANQAMTGDFTEKSEKLVRALTKWKNEAT